MICQDCKVEEGHLCQGDLMRCTPCENIRFKKPAPANKENSQPKGIAMPTIICELLAFAINKVSFMPRDDIVKICLDFYLDEEVWEAKQCLFDSCGEVLLERNIRLIARKGGDKRKQNLIDLFKALSVIAEDEMPNFVAKDLMRLPPIDTKNIDVTVLLGELKAIRAQLDETRLQALEVAHLRDEIGCLRRDLIAHKKGTQVQSIAVNDTAHGSQTTVMQVHHAIEDNEFPPLPSVPVEAPQRNEATFTEVVNRRKRPNFTSKNNQITDAKLETTKPVRKPLPVIGQRKMTKLTATSGRFVKIFATRFNPATTSIDIETYLKEDFDVDSKVSKLDTRFDTYASFKIEAQCKTDCNLLREGASK